MCPLIVSIYFLSDRVYIGPVWQVGTYACPLYVMPQIYARVCVYIDMCVCICTRVYVYTLMSA